MLDDSGRLQAEEGPDVRHRVVVVQVAGQQRQSLVELIAGAESRGDRPIASNRRRSIAVLTWESRELKDSP